MYRCDERRGVSEWVQVWAVPDFEVITMDTDGDFFALSENGMEKLIKTEMKEENEKVEYISLLSE